MSKKNMDFTIASLGEPKIKSPLALVDGKDAYQSHYVNDDQHILYDIEFDGDLSHHDFSNSGMLEKAGPREHIYFDPAKVRAGIVTCGGLCPGLNDVIRSIVMCLWYHYGTRRICGFRFGYRGFMAEFALPTVELNPDVVVDIHRQGGTILGSSRGLGDRIGDIVDSLERLNINMLFTIGGDGTQKGALDISLEAAKRGLKIAVVGIPKTIDNDLSFVEKSFGFETAVSCAVEAVAAAHVEARDAVNGVVVVKVMGRDSGFIAAHTALAINDANYVLIPEVPFDMENENGLLANLARRLEKRNHAVILVAEGAGQDHMKTTGTGDASGNIKYADIGAYLVDRIRSYFKAKQTEINLKYIDPSYMIRSAPANPNDSIYCARLGANAAHAAMAGKTGLIISRLHQHLVHIPIQLAVSKRNSIDPGGELWRDVVEATGQPLMLQERREKPRT
jgi:6-phosphofructokinase 1